MAEDAQTANSELGGFKKVWLFIYLMKWYNGLKYYHDYNNIKLASAVESSNFWCHSWDSLYQ